MRKRELILDFTSLLDIIMIILFFFIIFSHMETEDAKASCAAAEQQAVMLSAQANEKMNDAEEKLADAEEKEQRAAELLKAAEEADTQKAANIEGIFEFSHSNNLRVTLEMLTESTWRLNVYAADELIAAIPQDEETAMEAAFSEVIAAQGYDAADTILCVFLLNRKVPGTRAAYAEATKLFEKIKTEYPYFYYTEINSSILEGAFT